MARYIDADKFIKWIEKQKRLSKGYTIFMLQETATADVEEVKHGEWLLIVKRSNYLELPTCDTAKCSVCGKRIDVSETYFKRCPDCGAKMDGGKGE